MTTLAEDMIERRSYQRTALESALARLEVGAMLYVRHAEGTYGAARDTPAYLYLQSALLNARLALSLQMEGQNNEEQDNGNS